MKTRITHLLKLPALLALVITMLSGATSMAQTKRALIIGIDTYQPSPNVMANKTRAGWTNLDGCVNDATAIRDIIIARFGFEDKNVNSIYNQQASRERILSELQALVDKSVKGDIVFIYYAGHGSQMFNSLSSEEAGDKRDETIVPADLDDIRDKELAVLFNKLLDNGVILTLIFDSCHSGSIARGNNLPEISKSRQIEGNTMDAKDASSPAKPEDRGALVLSAAQPEQTAKEARDENGNPHGAFTIALMRALNSSPFNESAEILFLRIKAIMQANGSTQEPVLGANEQRKKQGLFGEDLSNVSGKTVVAVLKVNAPDNIDLQGGWAIGLNKGCELKKVGGDERIVLSDVSGMAKAKAKIISGDAGKIKAGDLFEVVVWASADKPALKVWFPSSAFTGNDLLKTSKNLESLIIDPNYKWVSDPTLTAPDYIIQYYNNSWWLLGPESEKTDLGKSLSASAITAKMKKGSGVYFQLPPHKDLISALKIGKGSENNAIDIVQDALSADYILAGRYVDHKLEYAWIRPNITVFDSSFLSTLPVRTDWMPSVSVEEVKNAGEKLTEYALKLGKINSWLSLSGPPDDGSFPFSLALKNLETGKYVASGTVVEGDRYDMVLVTDENKLKKWNNKSRYVYVFAIDAGGKTQQIFPYPNTGNEGNKLPTRIYDFEKEISLRMIITISDPFGVDSYFMISSDEAINNFQAFNSEGVITRSGTKSGNPLDDLLGNVGAGTRGITSNTPATWSVQRLSITSVPK